MKVNKPFTSVTITLESIEHLDFFKELLYVGKQHIVSRSGTLSFMTKSCFESPFYRKCEYLEGQLK
jgi:hypothetical protein